MDINKLVFYYTVHSVPDRPLSQKHMLYQALVNDLSVDGLDNANALIEAKELPHPLDMLRSRWLNYHADLTPLTSLALRVTTADVVKPIEFKVFSDICYYLTSDEEAELIIQQFQEYLKHTRMAHKSYGNEPICFDSESCRLIELDPDTVSFLRETQLDVIYGHLTGHYEPEVVEYR